MGSDFSNAGRVRGQASEDGRVAVEPLGRAFVSFAMVEERLVEAWGFMLRLPDRERGWHRLKASWPDMRRHNAFGDYGDMDAEAWPSMPGLRTAEVDRMDEALGWVDWVPEQHRALIGVVLGMLQRIDEPDWVWVAGVIGGVKADACRMRYSRAITRICERLSAAENRGVEGVKG
jgi:hypothetical protein